ncbi:hypothetical protein F4804DRAFT_328456 [Jackrogersella minutella]|nr:hypothetical protein F4804DRAFT_328456 [Jackrogersella minutella]
MSQYSANIYLSESQMVSGVLAIGTSNDASAAMEEGRFDDAIKGHLEALALKLRTHPPNSIPIGITLNGLGEAFYPGPGTTTR